MSGVTKAAGAPLHDPAGAKSALHNSTKAHGHVLIGPSANAAQHEAHDCHRKGNEVAMKKVVDMLYDKVLSNQDLAPFYKGVDMQQLSTQQQKVMTYVFGGRELLMLDSPEFDLRAIHIRPLVEGMTLQHWEAFVQHFQETLDNLAEIPAETKASAMLWIRSTKEAFRPPAAEEVEAYRRTSAGPAAAAGRCPFH